MAISADTRETITAERGFYYSPDAVVDTIVVQRLGVMDIRDLRHLAFLVASHDGGEITPSQLTGGLADLAKLDESNPVIGDLIEKLALDLGENDLSEWEKGFDSREGVEQYVEDVLVTMLDYNEEINKRLEE